MLFKNALAMRVEVFGNLADDILLDIVRVREREGVEATGFGVTRIISDAQPPAGAERPCHVDARRQYAKMKGIVGSDSNKHVVRNYTLLQKLKNSMLGCLDRCDVTGKHFRETS